MKSIRACVALLPGSTCEYDTYYVLKDLLGIQTDLLFYKEWRIEKYDLIFIPGGFSYGDYLRVGAIARFTPLIKALPEYVEKERGIVVGICNGFQILTEAKLLPGALLKNEGLKFICKPVKLRIQNASTPLTNLFSEGDEITLPIAHSDGRYFVDQEGLRKIREKRMIFLTYSGENPNGSIENIAGISNEKKNVFGMMPHPERYSDPLLGSDVGLLFFKSLLRYISSR